jgi:hypothetical protein
MTTVPWGATPGLDQIKIPRQFLDHLTDTLCYAA